MKPAKELYRMAKFAWDELNRKTPSETPAKRVARDVLIEIGWTMAEAIARGNSTALRLLANALDHERNPTDPDQAWQMLQEMPALFPGAKFATRDFVRNFKRHCLERGESCGFKRIEAFRKQIRAKAPEFGIKLDGRRSGRPRKK